MRSIKLIVHILTHALIRMRVDLVYHPFIESIIQAFSLRLPQHRCTAPWMTIDQIVQKIDTLIFHIDNYLTIINEDDEDGEDGCNIHGKVGGIQLAFHNSGHFNMMLIAHMH